MKIVLSLLILLSFTYSSESFESIKKAYYASYDYEEKGKYNEAIKVLAPIYQKHPKGYTLNLRIGWLFFLDKKYSDAKEHYKDASLANPYALDPRLGLLRIHLATASYIDAEKVANELLKIDFYNYYANLYMISALTAQKKYKIATEIVYKMLARYPTDIGYLESLIYIYKAQESPLLKKAYEDLLILDPDNVLAHTERLKKSSLPNKI